MTMFLPDEKAASTLEQTWEFCLDSFTIGRFGQLTVERGLEHVGSASPRSTARAQPISDFARGAL